jgi:hypothetical protein
MTPGELPPQVNDEARQLAAAKKCGEADGHTLWRPARRIGNGPSEEGGSRHGPDRKLLFE